MKKILLLPLLFLSASLFAQSNDDCFMCHTDPDMTYERNGKEVSIYTDQAKFENSAHGSLDCVSCHEGFDAEEIPHKEGSNIYKVNCGDCHDDISEGMANTIHARLDVPGAPECIDCHGYHTVQNLSKINNKAENFCSDCHDNQIKDPISFHVSADVTNESCSECHETEEIAANLTGSLHEGFSCVDCHSYVSSNFDEHMENPELASSANCAMCHSEAEEEYEKSIHGISIENGIDEAAHCWDCHGSHNILSPDDKESLVYPTNLAETCGSCHDDPEFSKKFDMSIQDPGKMYTQSVHGKLVQSGRMDAATCVMCHGAHDIKNRVMQGSKIAVTSIPETCGECHPDEQKEFEKSIHWARAVRGIRGAPVCNDCHSEHSISAITTVDERKASRQLQEQTCIRCHQSPFFSERFGIEGNVVSAYQDSYHGLAVMRGDEDAAMCVDCHSVHAILPSSNPESTVSEENVTKTCQSCHPEAQELFAKSYSHQTSIESAESVESFVQTFYFWMIIAVIGGMVLHNLLIFVFELRKRRRARRNQVTLPRMNRNEVIQHFILLVSFIVLAVTGFALKYPTSWWSEGLFSLGMTEPVRQWIHRISAVIMILLSLYHVGYLLATRRGREVLGYIIPKFEDIRAAIDNIAYYLRLRKTPPEFSKYDYMEKAEYWALIWGTIVMGATGLVLWFPTIVGDWAPLWFIKVSETIHFYEAILATLAILVWHFFFVILHPREYPMSFTWIDGQMSLENYRHHHEKHFKMMVLEWVKFSERIIKREDFKETTEMFISNLEQNDISPDEVIQGELNRDPKLRIWVEEELGKESVIKE